MITGVVNADREATIRLVAIGPNGQQQEIEAIVDTGFTGFLTLPTALVAALGFSWLCRQPGILADGSIDFFDVYVATVMWDGQLRTVEVEAADTEPLVGMSLLDHYSLRIDVLPGGVVTNWIAPLTQTRRVVQTTQTGPALSPSAPCFYRVAPERRTCPGSAPECCPSVNKTAPFTITQ
ncbi:MAG: clan AA aspartic protease [Deltaproteobacteria bacterium]|nr:clan AA aspartic protease [Deltaproteobacteria bacterium]